MLDQKGSIWQNGYTHAGRFGLDYDLSSRDRITWAVNAKLERYDFDFDIQTDVFASGEAYRLGLPRQGINSRLTLEEEAEQTVETSLNYRHDFGKEDHVLTADLAYTRGRETEDNRSDEYIIAVGTQRRDVPDVVQEADALETQLMLLAQADYVNPLSEKLKIEAGYRGNFRYLTNDFEIRDIDPLSGQSTINPATNMFTYDENINAAYGIVAVELGQWDLQAGLRYEHTLLYTRLVDTGQDTLRKYGNLFPTLHLGYDLGNGHLVQFSYSQRIQRPGFRDLNPFFTYANPTNLFAGNPGLNPEFTDSYEINYLKNWDKVTLSNSVYYRYSTDVIQRLTLPSDSSGSTLTRPENLATENSGGYELVLSSQLRSWWNVDASGNLFYSQLNAQELDPSYNQQFVSWTARFNSRMSFKRWFDFQMLVNYDAPRKNVQGNTFSSWNLDFGLSREVLNQRGVLAFRASDVFWTTRFKSDGQQDSLRFTREFRRQTQRFIISFTYLINQKNQKRGKSNDRQNFGGEGGGDF
ncbi:MAG: TonB-dependent receptor [Cytophagales bacterium]|nr:TonB-dependent receptor [Cytophagales bacterium]